MPLNLEKAARDSRAFLNFLSGQLSHEDEKGQTFILLKASLHALRDRITVQQSLHLLAQLPIFMKVIYVEGWKYREHPEKIDSQEEFVEYVKNLQYRYGEYEFNWPEPTAELVTVVYNSLRRYVNEGEIQKIVAELPRSLKPLFELRSIHLTEENQPSQPGEGNSRNDNKIFIPESTSPTHAYESDKAEIRTIALSESEELFEEEGLNQAGVGVGGGGAMGTTSGGTLESVGGGSRNITQGKGYDTLGIGIKSHSIVSNSLRGNQQETAQANTSHTAESSQPSAAEATEANTAAENDAPTGETFSAGNKRTGGTLREKAKGILATGEKPDSGIGNA